MLMIRACAAATIESMGVDALRVRILLPKQQQKIVCIPDVCVCLAPEEQRTLSNVIIQYI